MIDKIHFRKKKVFEKQRRNAEVNDEVKKQLKGFITVQFWKTWKSAVDRTMEVPV